MHESFDLIRDVLLMSCDLWQILQTSKAVSTMISAYNQLNADVWGERPELGFDESCKVNRNCATFCVAVGAEVLPVCICSLQVATRTKWQHILGSSGTSLSLQDWMGKRWAAACFIRLS